MASGASGTVINDFAADNFDHSGWDSSAAPTSAQSTANGRPIQYHPVPPGTPAWGKGWKQAVVKHYNHTVSFSMHGSSVVAAAKLSWISIRPIATRGVSRCCE